MALKSFPVSTLKDTLLKYGTIKLEEKELKLIDRSKNIQHNRYYKSKKQKTISNQQQMTHTSTHVETDCLLSLVLNETDNKSPIPQKLKCYVKCKSHQSARVSKSYKPIF